MATTTAVAGGSETVAKQEMGVVPAKRTWPLWKKLTIAAVAIVVVGLAVGLGVGLTVGRDNGDGNNDNDNSSSDSSSGSDSSNADSSNNSTSSDTDIDAEAIAKRVWKPQVGASWQIVLRFPIVLPSSGDAAALEPDVDIWDLDVYDNDEATFAALKKAGKRVICYFSAGSWEDWRDDKDDFAAADLGKTLDGWPDEKWINVSSPAVRDIMKKRIKLAADKGCDAIDPDNVDGYQNQNGLGLTEKDAVSYIKFLSAEAARYNMSTGLKNAGDIIPDVLPYVHFSVNEQCIQYGECEDFAAFTEDKKPVFNIEYPDSAPRVSDKTRETICSGKGKAAGSADFSRLIKKMDLDGWVMACDDDGETFTTEVDDSDSD